MADVIITGASRGIGRALALALARKGERLVLVARDRGQLDALAGELRALGARVELVPADLSSIAGARALGQRLAELAAPGSTLVHNAGLWPTKREHVDGLERAFVVNGAAPLALQRPLLDAGRLRRVLLVSAGLIIKARYDAARTPTGDDFSAIGTYCTTKLVAALGMRDVAAARPEVDFLVMHPGVVRTGLGDRSGLLGALLRLVKRSWESPETCAARLARVLDRPRWSEPGRAAWWIEEQEEPWPAVAEDEATRRAVRETLARLAV